ncbi:alpha-glucan family phosphorylase [Nocardioides rotundus]|uniref:alpha-glucan family phosphorylase n=1 Tax=Nocardioides rotundus TaxID=1774216 RepID=UPI001CBC0F8E|nr:alpha-glucan family phosphorylase [Nocardioides rotundus]UAL28391.1 alpha-glucan family phosphorylase [Nocardioides rotundus]
MRAIRRFTVRPVLPPQLAALSELAANLRWSWHPPTQAVFRDVDPAAWKAVGHDPVRLLGAVSRERWAGLAAHAGFLERLAAVRADLATYLSDDRWYAQRAGEDAPRQIAYFSPEYGITAVLPQYSGGLGILAGDHLKAASDLGIPLTGVGLLYKYGYFKQSLNRDGWQQETYPVLDPDELPLSVLRESDGSRATVTIPLPDGPDLVARIWVAQVGRVPLLLLDSDVEENPQHYREVTDRLYGGTTEHRLRQELLLGVGGVRALRAWSRIAGAPAPEVFHTNEGHAGFLGLERIRELTVADGGPALDFDTALEVTRAGTVFTTHTPVPAGIDRFPRELVEQYFGGGSSPVPGVPVERVLALGSEDYEGGDAGVFNMAVMGFRLAQRANGVSQLHGHVSRHMFNGLWPAFDEAEVPITSITNGVHAPTWVADEVFELAEADGVPRDSADLDAFWDLVDRIPADRIWTLKRSLRQNLVQDARERIAKSWRKRGAASAELGWIDTALDPDVLTIGFARRVPTYKRLTLMLRDPERLKRLLLDPERPIQLVIAGKSHPADETGKRLIQEMVRFADDPEVRHRIAFLPNYDIAMAQPLYPGCDVWLNNPLRPYEACGTSGMKAALSGGLNLSILDGWWDEWYDGRNGWAIPSADGVDDPDRRDDLEAAALYDLLENEVAPRFYDRDDAGIPQGWLDMVRHTLKSLGPKVLATRQVRDYVEQLYAPAARSSRALNDDYEGARALASWKQRTKAGWSQVRVEHVESGDVGDAPEVGQTLSVRAFVALGDLAPDDVDVQVVAGSPSSEDALSDPAVASMQPVESYEGGRYRYDAEVTLDRAGAFGYTVRVVPRHRGIASVAEMGLAALPAG